MAEGKVFESALTNESNPQYVRGIDSSGRSIKVPASSFAKPSEVQELISASEAERQRIFEQNEAHRQELPNKVAALELRVNDLESSEDIGGGSASGTGWNAEQIYILDEIGNHVNFTDENGGKLWDRLIQSLKAPSVVKLQSISAVYSGGSVAVGTLTQNLSLSVKALYSNGAERVVYGYSLNPSTIALGSNTIVVSYADKTATFNVVGIEIPQEATLQSISAVFNGESAEVGTSAEDLDITVTGHYSDGTTRTETEWTISGSVIEGNNTFYIYLADKSCVVNVSGVATEQIPDNKILQFNGVSEGSYGAFYIPTESLDDGLYYYKLDDSIQSSLYARINKYGIIAIIGSKSIAVGISPSYNNNDKITQYSIDGGNIKLAGSNLSRLYDNTIYNLYKLDTEDYKNGSYEVIEDNSYLNSIHLPNEFNTNNLAAAIIEVPSSLNTSNSGDGGRCPKVVLISNEGIVRTMGKNYANENQSVTITDNIIVGATAVRIYKGTKATFYSVKVQVP